MYSLLVSGCCNIKYYCIILLLGSGYLIIYNTTNINNNN